MIALRLLGGATSATLGFLGVDQVTSNGPDLGGIALLITAISGLIGTIGAIVLGFRKKSPDAAEQALIAVAKILEHRDDDE